MWHKAEWMGRPLRLELTNVGVLVKLANRYTTKGARYLSLPPTRHNLTQGQKPESRLKYTTKGPPLL